MNLSQQSDVLIIGGGLAGCEAAWQAASRGCRVALYEMKPAKFSPAHESSQLAELVCSNSFRSDALGSAVGLLKEEMRLLDSLIMGVAQQTRVPAGKALAVDRQKFSEYISQKIEGHPLITVYRHEIDSLPENCGEHSEKPLVLATGPLTTPSMATSLGRFLGEEYLFFYDAIAPIVEVDSLDQGIIYRASRYDDGPGDYLNCPMDRDQYSNFIAELKKADKVPLKSFEDTKYFEGCLPIEVMVERGDDTPRFGPMKPVGLPDPRTGKSPYAVIQLRMENEAGSHANMVGFQTKLTYPEQKRIFSMIPGMEKVHFARLGSIHRNTFICAPRVLNSSLQVKNRPGLLLAGQLTGVEGYVESTAMGLLAGRNAAALVKGEPIVVPPLDTAHGALLQHLTGSEPKNFQPSNINFGLFPELNKKMPKKLRGEYRAQKALESFKKWQELQK